MREPLEPAHRALLAAMLFVGLALAWSAGPAAAHDGKGLITVENEAIDGTTADITVRVTWSSDGHPALDATVTAVVVASDGSSGTPVALSPLDDDGRYRGTVELPGSGRWTVRFTSIDPTGTIEASMAAATPETVPGSSTAPPSPTEATSPTTADEAAASEQGPSSSGGTGDDGRGVLVASGIAAVAIVVVGSLVFRRIQQRDQRRDREAPVR